jgi:hypothetical protein
MPDDEVTELPDPAEKLEELQTRFIQIIIGNKNSGELIHKLIQSKISKQMYYFQRELLISRSSALLGWEMFFLRDRFGDLLLLTTYVNRITLLLLLFF